MKKLTFLSLAISFLLGFFCLGTAVTSILVSFLSPAAYLLNEKYLAENFNPSATTAVFHNQLFTVPSLPEPSALLAQVLGWGSADKRIEIDLTNQRLYAYEGDRKVFDFLVSTGKWGRTPTGNFQTWVKLRATLMQGGSKVLKTYYYLPNVPYTMYFEGQTSEGRTISRAQGYGIHGTYWHNNFGHPMSHGCINMKTEEAEQLYYWAMPPLSGKATSVWAGKDNPGTPISIYGQAPAQ